MAEQDKVAMALAQHQDLLERLLETTQDLFILQCLQARMPVHPVKSLLGVSTDRVTRISKIQRKAAARTKVTEKSKGVEK